MYPRIFVSIASYRDPECQHTVKDLFDQATHPERVFVGLCWQYDPEEDAHCFEVPYPRPENVREERIHWRDAEGVCWARWKTQQLWQGEEYYLQIDSHMRFVPGWDEKIIAELAACQGEKPVLTASIAKYTPPNEKEKNPKPSILRSGPFATDGSIRNRGACLNRAPKKPLNAAFISAGFLFARSDLVNEVPYDPYLYFDQEEITYAMRLYTHGWNLFSARTPFVYHYYLKPGQKDARPLAWGDVKKTPEQEAHYRFLRERAQKRFNHITGYTTSKDAEVLRELERYGLGTARSLREYERYCGIDFSTKRVSEHALRARFIEGLSACLSGPLFVPELEDKNAPPLTLMSEEERLALATPEPPPTAAASSTATQLPRIFVGIAAYRDPECQHTVRDLFAKAAHPERIIVGICWQYDEKEDTHCFTHPSPRPEQMRIKHYTPAGGRGIGWARSEAQTLWQGEEYVLHIDGHMRFEPGWDSALIDMHTRAPLQPAAISAFLPNYTPPNDLKYFDGQLSRVRIDHMGSAGHPAVFHLAGDIINRDDPRGGLYASPFIVGNFLFGDAQMFQRVPIDPYLFFHGEEAAHSARLWTHGYTVYQPDRVVAYHRWVKNASERGGEYRKLNRPEVLLTRTRVRHLLGLELSEDTEALREIDRFGHGTARTLEDFWRYAGIDPEAHTASPEAKKGFWNTEVLEEAAARAPSLPRIFVQIAAYRDPECQHTVHDLFTKAAHPERVFAGIVWQYIKEEDADFFQVPSPRPENTRTLHIDARESMGVCWARAKGQSLWQGEEFTLQIDSHMRFEPGWDDTLLDMLAMCGSPRAVLTTYPAGYTPPATIPHRTTHRLIAKQFDDQGIFTMASRHVPETEPQPVLGAFVGACMLFGPASIIRDVPYDPELYFFGEEISLSVRLWTHGYDIYHPHRPVMYHDWERKSRRTHFDDHRNWPELNRRAFARVRHVLGTELSSDPEVVRDIQTYGLGHARSLAEYQRFSGIDFARRTIHPQAFEGRFPVGSTAPASRAPAVIRSHNTAHQPKRVLASAGFEVFDDFLPEDRLEALYQHVTRLDYHTINTHGKVRKVWDLTNGFPLRSENNVFYFAKPETRVQADWAFPTGTPMDLFMEQLVRHHPAAQHLVGSAGVWDHVSATAWIYPQGTGLSMHDDGSGVYSGAYVFFLTPRWKPHWGGLLIVLDDESNRSIQEFKKQKDGLAFHQQKWLHITEHDDLAMARGLGHCVMPKRNRIVYIHPDAYHMVTQINPAAGDNVRISLAGFFQRNAMKKDGK